jgi:hypothetical protein
MQRDSMRDGIHRVRTAVWPVLQTSVAAALAWELARLLPGHERPLFAPIVAIVAMGTSAGRRARHAVMLVLGAFMGIVVADVLDLVVGNAAWTIVLAVFAAMSLALLLSRESMFVTQAGLSALLAFAVDRQAGHLAPDRLVDALIGGGVAILFGAVLFPLDPVRTTADAGRPLFGALARKLEDAAAALRSGDPDLAERAWARDFDLGALEEAVMLGLQAARIAPRRVRDRARMLAYAGLVARLPPISRSVRVIAGSARRLVRAGTPVAPELVEATELIASSIRALEHWLAQEDQQSREAARRDAEEALRRAQRVRDPAGPAATIVHLVEVVAGEILRATG